MEAIINGAHCAAPERSFQGAESEPLELVEKRIRGVLAESDGGIRDMCAHIACSGGKKIRPQLVLRSGAAFSAINARMVDAAVASELIHMASLVHDDVIDQSGLRRGKPSVNRLWGNHAALLCGDWLFAKAFGVLSGRGMAGCMRVMVEAIQSMCQGELMQAANQYNLDMGLDVYLDVISRKTASLLEGCCKAGALSGNAGASGVRAVGAFGLNIGIAFQIIDDIMDFKGSADKMGKPKGEDFSHGIVTLPVILLLKDGKYGGPARKLLSDRGFSADSAALIYEMLTACDVVEASCRMAWAYIDKAQCCLEALPQSENRKFLYDLASALRQREK